MNPVLFGVTYTASWLLMGLGVFLALRVGSDILRGASMRQPGARPLVVVREPIRAALVALVALLGVGIVYAGAYTVYALMTIR